MTLFGGVRVCVALDAGGVRAARVAVGLRGAEALAWTRAPLASGALVPHPAERNLADAEAVRQALSRVATALDVRPGTPVRLVLPEGVARPVLLEEPRGVARHDFALFRLGPGLPFAPEEAVVGTLAVGSGRIVACALRRSVGAEYEQVVREAGLLPDGVFLAPLTSLATLLRKPPAQAEVALVLGDAACLLAAFGDGRLRALRARRRVESHDEPRRLLEEVERTATMAELRGSPRLALHGPGSQSLAAVFGLQGRPVQAGVSPVAGLPAEASEWTWLAGAAA